MSVFDDNEDEQPNSSSSVASALRGGDEDEAPEETPNPVDGGTQAAQPAGQVDESAQQYLAPLPAEEDHGDPSENAGPTSTDSAASSPDTEAYMKPITPPPLAKYTAPADHSGDMAAMTAQKQKEAAENTKPSTLRKIGAILAGIGETRLTGNIQQGINTARSIDNGPRAAAQARWQQQEAPIQSQLNADQAQDTATSRANTLTEQQNRLAETNYGNQIRGQQDQARAENYQAQAEARRNTITAFTPDDPAKPYAGGTGTTTDGRTFKGIPPPAQWLATWEKNPTNVANAQAQKGVATLNALEKSGVKLTPEQRAIVASGGKLTPTVRTTVSIRENPDGSAVTNNKNMPTSAGFDALINKRTADYNLWQKNYDTELKATRTPGQKAEVEAKYEGQRNDLQNKWDQTLSDYDPKGTLSHAAPAQQLPAAQPKTTAPAAAPSRPAGSAQQPVVRHYQGRPYTQDAKTGQWVLQQPGR